MVDKFSPNARDSSIVERFADTGNGAFARAQVNMASAAAGGTTGARIIAAASDNATIVKASPGQLYGVEMSNNAAYAVFLKLYNKATAPTAADTPVRTIQIAPGGRCEINRPNGMVFSAGISYRTTKVLADNDATVVAAGDLVGSIDFA